MDFDSKYAGKYHFIPAIMELISKYAGKYLFG